jgi:hypothetical protein
MREEKIMYAAVLRREHSFAGPFVNPD